MGYKNGNENNSVINAMQIRGADVNIDFILLGRIVFNQQSNGYDKKMLIGKSDYYCDMLTRGHSCFILAVCCKLSYNQLCIKDLKCL